MCYVQPAPKVVPQSGEAPVRTAHLECDPGAVQSTSLRATAGIITVSSRISRTPKPQVTDGAKGKYLVNRVYYYTVIGPLFNREKKPIVNSVF
jgi:hypothetical protein